MTDSYPITPNTLTNPLLARVKMPGETYTLPSGGVFYTPDVELCASAINNCEVHVHPMTVIDEIVLKTPDLLFSGEAIRQVFSRCIPQIKQTDKILAKDIDFLLLCLRKVSFGDEVDLELKHPNCTGDSPKKHSYRASVTGFINTSKRIDPTTVDHTYNITLQNDQKVSVIPIRFGDYIKTMQVHDQERDLPPATQAKIFAEALVGVIVSVDEITDRDMILEWLVTLPPMYITTLTESMDAGSHWGPDYVQKTQCRDCGETIELIAPMNPLVFFS